MDSTTLVAIVNFILLVLHESRYTTSRYVHINVDQYNSAEFNAAYDFLYYNTDIALTRSGPIVSITLDSAFNDFCSTFIHASKLPKIGATEQCTCCTARTATVDSQTLEGPLIGVSMDVSKNVSETVLEY
jgi:hypothetical protein